ncbi:hypothetical protein [Clostridium lundense]|nr:hypothetical protein [Clostridium lundense]
MSIKQEELLEKILRELQDIKVILQENSQNINLLTEKEDSLD